MKALMRSAPISIQFHPMAKCYVSMKSLSEWRGSLDVPPSNASLSHSSFSMSRVNKILVAWAVLFGLEFISLGLATHGTFSWTNQYIPPLLEAASHTNFWVAELYAKTNDGFVHEGYGEPTAQSEVFLTAKENLGISVPSFVVSPLFFRIILTPKVPRYISKSVLNL